MAKKVKKAVKAKKSVAIISKSQAPAGRWRSKIWVFFVAAVLTTSASQELFGQRVQPVWVINNNRGPIDYDAFDPLILLLGVGLIIFLVWLWFHNLFRQAASFRRPGGSILDAWNRPGPWFLVASFIFVTSGIRFLVILPDDGMKSVSLLTRVSFGVCWVLCIVAIFVGLSKMPKRR